MATVKKISFSVDKKLSMNYNSVGMQIGVEAELAENEGIAESTQLRSMVEDILDGMLIESLQGLPNLVTKAKAKM
jgi:hypothetical protein